MNNLIPLPVPSKKASQSHYHILLNAFKEGKLCQYLFSTLRAKGANALVRFLMRLLGYRKPDLSNLIVANGIHIVDIGAADGLHPRWKQISRGVKITCFEPEPIAFKKLQEQYRANPAKMKILNTGLSGTGWGRTLYVTAWPRSSSLYKPNADFIEKTFIRNHFQVVKELEIETCKLADVCEPFDFIKIDTEGSELEILKGAGGLLDECIGMELEVRYNSKIYGSDLPLFDEVQAFCQGQGFCLCDLSIPGRWHFLLSDNRLESKGFVVAGDALYVRFPEDITELVSSGRWGIHKIGNAAAIYLAYNNFEFAYILISEAVTNGLITQDDPIYSETIELVNQQSGRKKFVSYKSLKRFHSFLSGTDPNKDLGF